MICHGELVARKPCPRYLTQFYLMCSAGGALGGVIVAIVCPWLFSNYFEMNLMLLAGYVLGVSVLFVEQSTSFAPSRLPRWAIGLAGFLGLLVVVHAQLEALPVGQLASTRNFYGVLSVLEHETSDPTERGRALVHGRIMHGFQYLQSPLDRQATKYYADHTGIGLTLRHFPREDSLRVGVVGLVGVHWPRMGNPETTTGSTRSILPSTGSPRSTSRSCVIAKPNVMWCWVTPV